MRYASWNHRLILAQVLFFVCVSLPSLLFAQDLQKTCGPEGKNPLIKFYQTYISGIDGNRCPMSPSCSNYAAKAIDKHGLLIGWIMTCDRLVRCGRDETHLSPEVTVNGRHLFYDPVKANDFWWFPSKPPSSEIDSSQMADSFTTLKQCPAVGEKARQ